MYTHNDKFHPFCELATLPFGQDKLILNPKPQIRKPQPYDWRSTAPEHLYLIACMYVCVCVCVCVNILIH